MCCLSKSLVNCTFCIVKQQFFTEGYFYWQVTNGTLDTERALNVVKKYTSHPSLNMTLVIKSCELNYISLNELTSCSQMAAFFHCFFTNLYKYNETVINLSTSTEPNFDSTFSDQTSNDATESVTDVTDTENLADDLNLDKTESVTDFKNDANVEDVTNVTNIDDEIVTNTVDFEDISIITDATS